MTERLQKAIAQAGVASRRHAEALIVAGAVSVNGHVVTELGTKVEPGDQVSVNGVPIAKQKLQYFLLYKPRGVITAVTDNKHRKVVTDFFDDVRERLYPVGRLDYDTSGLLLMTNDGEFANMMMHPRYNIDKRYIAKVQGIPTSMQLQPLRDGIMVEGRRLAKAKAKVLSRDNTRKTAIVELTIHQGLNHQVKKMLKQVGFPVIKLSREAFGPLDLSGLSAGDYRRLTHLEVAELKDAAK